MNIRKKTKKMGLLMISTLGLSFINYASSSNGNKSSEIEKLIQQQYSNQNYDLMSMKDSNKGVVSRPSEKEFSANRKTQTMPFEENKNEKIQNKGTLALNMSREQLLAVADKIFENETGGSKDKLVHWNSGESFPDMVSFYKSKGIKLPKILEENVHSPWNSRSELLAKKERGDKDINELINFFDSTRDIQVMFIYERLQSSLDKMLAVANDKENLKNQFYRMVNTPNGLYALIDYVNFKGEGLKGVAAYNNQAWGLKQVLENMSGTSIGYEALVEFSDSAKYILSKRVRNAPRNESCWLKGWYNRVDTYKTFQIGNPGAITADVSGK